MKSKPLLPLLPVFLVLAWLLLNNSVGLGQLLLGVLFAMLIGWAVARLRPLPAWPRRLQVAIGLLVRVSVDIVRSNVAVSSLILCRPFNLQPSSGFIHIPLQLRDPHGLAMLSIIVTATPGTVWSGHDLDSNVLTLHVLDLQDEVAWVRTIKQRYEYSLMEIFECCSPHP